MDALLLACKLTAAEHVSCIAPPLPPPKPHTHTPPPPHKLTLPQFETAVGGSCLRTDLTASFDPPLCLSAHLQFETAVEGSRLRTDLMADGGVAPVAATAEQAASATRTLGGGEEQFAFRRAVSRLHEMQSELYLATRPRQ